LDAKLEINVVRFEGDLPFVQLCNGERNLNDELRTLLPVRPAKIQQKSMDETGAESAELRANPVQAIDCFDTYKPMINDSEVYAVQLTTVDIESECFHVLFLRDVLSDIMNVLREWDGSQRPLTTPARPKMLVCARYAGDGLWYRAWIESVTGNACHSH
jgi:hypothetical protein